MSAKPVQTRQQQIQAFLASTAFAGAELRPLAGDASFRRYIRVCDGRRSAMLMDAPPDKEDVRPYVKVAKSLYVYGYSVPDIMASAPEQGLLLLEDLGDNSFSLVLKDAEKHAVSEVDLYTAAIDVLVEWHEKRKILAEAAALPAYDIALLIREVKLFSDWYLPQVMGIERTKAVRGEYETLWRGILQEAALATDCFVHRDYHADNLMWLPSRTGTKSVGLLDFQDAVSGDPAYDLVSLLEDARRDVPKALCTKMLDRYIVRSGADREKFLAAYAVLGAQRNSKIIGIFVRLAARDGKHHYLSLLPRVWRHLEHDLMHPALAPLKSWIDANIPAQWRGVTMVRHTSQELAIGA